MKYFAVFYVQKANGKALTKINTLNNLLLTTKK